MELMESISLNYKYLKRKRGKEARTRLMDLIKYEIHDHRSLNFSLKKYILEQQ